jgi:hypothetical protein
VLEGLFTSRAERERRARIDRMVGVGTGLLILDTAVSQAAGQQRVQPRLSREYVLGYTDTVGQRRVAAYGARVGSLTAAVDAQREARERQMSRAADLRRLGFVTVAAALLAQVVAGVGWWAPGLAALGLIMVATGVWSRLRVPAPLPDPVLPPAPVVFPSAPRKSPACALLQQAERKRDALDAVAALLETRDPVAAVLLREARDAAELRVASAASLHELLRWDVLDSREVLGQSQEYADALVQLQCAVAEHAELLPLAHRALDQGGADASEALARRAGLASAVG